jgi:hypothetical protein
MKKFTCGIFALVLFGCTSVNKDIIAQIGDKQYLLEVSKTDNERAKGLSDRKSLDKNNGMLFMFKNKAIQTFWMKNTHIPLQIIFLNECKIIDIQEMTVEQDPVNPITIYTSALPADMAIELNTGSVSQDLLNTAVSDLCDKPSLKQPL